jgi:hypothetical protein
MFHKQEINKYICKIYKDINLAAAINIQLFLWIQ